MNTILLTFIFVIVLIILLTVLSFASTANTDLADIYKDDSNLTSGKAWIVYGIAIIWPIWLGIVLGLIALFVFGPELIPTLGKTIVYIGVIIVLLSVVFLAFACILATYYIRQSSDANPSKASAQTNIEYAAGLATFTLVFIVTAYWLVYRTPKTPNMSEYPGDREPQRYPPRYPPPGYPPQEYPQEPNQSYPPQEYPQEPNQGYPPQRQGYPQRAFPARNELPRGRVPGNVSPRINPGNASKAEGFLAKNAGKIERASMKASSVGLQAVEEVA